MKEYIEQRGGVKELSGDEKAALAKMVKEAEEVESNWLSRRRAFSASVQEALDLAQFQLCTLDFVKNALNNVYGFLFGAIQLSSHWR